MGELVDELKIWEHTNKDKGHKLKEKKNTRTSMVATFRKENIQDQEPRYLSFIHPRPTYHQRLYKRSLMVAVENRPIPEHADKYQINPGREVVMH